MPKQLTLLLDTNVLIPLQDSYAVLGMVFKTPVKPEWRERCAAGTMAS